MRHQGHCLRFKRHLFVPPLNRSLMCICRLVKGHHRRQEDSSGNCKCNGNCVGESYRNSFALTGLCLLLLLLLIVGWRDLLLLDKRLRLLLRAFIILKPVVYNFFIQFNIKKPTFYLLAACRCMYHTTYYGVYLPKKVWKIAYISF